MLLNSYTREDSYISVNSFCRFDKILFALLLALLSWRNSQVFGFRVFYWKVIVNFCRMFEVAIFVFSFLSVLHNFASTVNLFFRQGYLYLKSIPYIPQDVSRLRRRHSRNVLNLKKHQDTNEQFIANCTYSITVIADQIRTNVGFD